MLVYLYALLVRRNIDTAVRVEVPRHEAEILRAVHGSESVELLQAEPVGTFAVSEHGYEERERLNAKYGMRSPDTGWTDFMFPSDVMLMQAVAAGTVEPQDEPAKPYEKMKVAELKAVLSDLGVPYESDANKDVLLDLVKQHAPAV